MNHARLYKSAALTLTVAAALGGPVAGHAEDTDIFLLNGSSAGARPNVLLMLDNAASNNSSVTLLNGSSGDKLEMLRQVLNNIVDPMNSPYFPACSVSRSAGVETRVPAGCVTRSEVSDLLGSINLGLMLFNPSGSDKGAYVRYHVRPMNLDANRAGILSKINPSVPQANNAPYAKSMHEAYLYFGGKPAYAGFDSHNPYDSAAGNGSNYVSPAADSCQNNYIIFVGNGGPDSGEDRDAQQLLTNIGGKLPSDPVQFSPNNVASNWFDEYARTMKKQDVAPLAGIQNITTYTIAIQNPADNNYRTNPVASARELLKSGASLGGGEYYEAQNGQAAMRAFVELLRKLQATSTVFSAVTLPVSVNVRGTYLNQVYMGQFRPDANANPRWVGNLKQYQIALNASGNPVLADRNRQNVEDTVNGFLLADKTSFWTTPSTYWTFDPLGNPASASDAPDGAVVEKGGVAQKLRAAYATSQDSRVLYTCTGTCLRNGEAWSSALFNTGNNSIALPGAADATERNSIINWVRGQDNIDNEDSDGVATDARARIHGDLLHSRPAVVNYNRNSDDRDIVIYYGANDGIFHAVKGGQNDTDGGEKWGIVFPEFFGKFKRMRDNSPNISASAPKPYFVDGPVSVYQKDADSDGRIVAANGDKVYLYVGMRRGGRFMYALDVSDPDTPKHLWRIDNSGDFAELGQTWSAPRPAKIRAVQNDPVVIFGGGYDAENEDALPAGANDKGRAIFVVNGRTGALIRKIQMEHSVTADVTVVDRNNDGLSDRIYAVDTKGNVWRVDIDNADPAEWNTYQIAALGGSGVNARKFLNKPDMVPGSSYDAIMIGSGDREHPFETSIVNRFYMVKDPNTQLTGTALNITEDDLADVTANPYQSTPLPSDKKGWYLTLETGEKVVDNPITVFGTTFFGTNRPTPPAPGVCTGNLGEARLYSVGFQSGNAMLDVNANGIVNTSDRFEVIKGGAFLPSPTYAPVTINGKVVNAVCTGPHCFSPGAAAHAPRRYRTYWHTKAD